ncbi:MAG: sugar phosphate isomerase/epimerase [Candidatus Hydrogenedentes bacterium]|nr:sugar phosphate isomerase/epimerase [Candidatus Hydrogenedentota bacterium]
MTSITRRTFLKQTAGLSAAALGAAALGPVFLGESLALAAEKGAKMRFGLVTYLWGKDWDLPTLIANCEASQVLGVELRTTHKHGVERELTAQQRAEVKKRFADSPVVHVGIGSNENYDSPDPEKLKASIQATKDFVLLSRDTGGSGVKVKPNDFHEGVPREQTIEQIGKALNEVGAFAGDLGQQIRLEVHGQCCELPTMKAIMDVADNPHVGVCWNSNDKDLIGEGLEHNFNLVKDRFGATAHVRELNKGSYPYQQLMDMFVAMDYDGWILLEARDMPDKPVEALIEQREVWAKMIGRA